MKLDMLADAGFVGENSNKARDAMNVQNLHSVYNLTIIKQKNTH
jgi:hypothetical protein